MRARAPRYPVVTTTTLSIAGSVLLGRPRSIRRDGQELLARLRPPLALLGSTPSLDASTGWLVAVNHFRSPSFRAWWVGLALAGVLDTDIHFVMSTAWTYLDPVRSRLITPATEWAFRRAARIYGFTSMPPMPPRPWEVEERARAVRSLLRYLDRTARPVVGLAPEGSDSPDGALMVPPPGVGRLLGVLGKRGLRLLPAGLYEEQGRLCLRFGKPEPIPAPPSRGSEGRDEVIADAVMRAIAVTLPDYLRGVYR